MRLRIFLLWLVSNFLFIGIASWLAGTWYLAWEPTVALIAELTLIMLPNLLLPIVALRYWWPGKIDNLRQALGFQWHGRRTVISGLAGFVLLYGVILLQSWFLGESIPYNLPGEDGSLGPVENIAEIIGLLLLLLLMLVLTVFGEETMFRGLIQTQIEKAYGPVAGVLIAALLFGLRHLPADLFYAQAWDATPRMWLSRQAQLYTTALILSLVRHVGKSTYSSAITHALLLIFVLF